MVDSRDWVDWGFFHSVGVFQLLLPGQAPAFWDVQAILSRVNAVPIFRFREIVLSSFVCAATTSSVKQGESFIPEIPLGHVLFRPP